ncbi:hypothetical protein D3C76_1705910 [compost metagenome]
MRLQVTKDGRAVVALTQGIAQRRAEALLARSVEQKRLHVLRQDFDDFFQQIIANQPFPAMQSLGQRMLVA